MRSWRLRSRVAAVSVGVSALAGALAWTEAAVVPELGFISFYLPLMVVVGWWAGPSPAVGVATLASLVWFVGYQTSGGSDPLATTAWNALNHLFALGAVGGLTGIVRRGRARLLDQARTDAITGLPNGRAFLEHLEREAARARRNGTPLCVAYADLDNFKRLNDLYGHASGNAFLEEVGQVLRDSLRAGDVPARVGGDEFAVLFDQADAEDAAAIGRRLVARIQALGGSYPKAALGASFGVVHLSHPPEPQAILHLADAAMYRAKQAGKGEVCVSRVDPLGAGIGLSPAALATVELTPPAEPAQAGSGPIN